MNYLEFAPHTDGLAALWQGNYNKSLWEEMENGGCWPLYEVMRCAAAPLDGPEGFIPKRDLEEVFAFMRAHEIPAVEPESLAVLTLLLHAGVRIVTLVEVQR